MASTEPQQHSSSIGRIRRLVPLKKDPEPQRHPLIFPTTNSVDPTAAKKKMGFALRGLGCASASSASLALAPDSSAAATAVRSSADWQGKRRPRRGRGRKTKGRAQQTSPAAEVADVSDVWCAPGVVFGAEASVDCVVAHRRERIHRERHCTVRRIGDEEIMSSFLDCPSSIETRHFGSGALHSGHLRYVRGGYRCSPAEFEEVLLHCSLVSLSLSSCSWPWGTLKVLLHCYLASLFVFVAVGNPKWLAPLSSWLPLGTLKMMMFQTRVFLGGVDIHDNYKDLRLDVDNMSYEELLELSEKIGYVNTGLSEEEILRNLRKPKHSLFGASPTQKEWKCIICQEEYEVNDDMGKLECGHSYHTHCIKQWLLRKNACPVCKTAMGKS